MKLHYFSTSTYCVALTRQGQDCVTPVCLRMLAALMKMCPDGRCVTKRELCHYLGRRFATDFYVSSCLTRLRKAGLVTYEDKLARTLRPACRFFPAGP